MCWLSYPTTSIRRVTDLLLPVVREVARDGASELRVATRLDRKILNLGN